jgi:hypothetical protein
MSKGISDTTYFDPSPMGTGGGGMRWTIQTFYDEYAARARGDAWVTSTYTVALPSLADQFNTAMLRHLNETSRAVNAWGFDHHVTNVLSGTLSAGLSSNWQHELLFLQDIADGWADGVVNEPRRDLVQFVTMQELSAIYDNWSHRSTNLPAVLR